MNRLLVSAVFVIALGLAPARAGAQSKQECADAYIAGQVARKEGHLRDARARFEVCAAASCPAVLQSDCKPWLGQLELDVPTLTVTVTNEAGTVVAGAAVTVDGAPIPAGGASALDPGEHVVRVEASGMPPDERRVTLAAGEGNQTITVRLSPQAKPVTDGGRRVPVAPILLGASGVVALGLFAGLGAVGNGKRAALDALGCKPDCSSADVSTGRSLYLGADVSLGVGLAALVAAGVALAVQLGAPAPTTKALTFSPSRGGGALTFHFLKRGTS